LIAAVKEDRISHAQLFSGAEGSAALPLAIAYAQFIACTNRFETDSCGVCNSCLKMGKLIHPDLHFTLPVNQERSSTEIKTADFLVQWRNLFLKNPFIGLEDWSSTLDLGNKQPFISNFEAHEKIKALFFKSFESEYKFLIMWLPEKMRVEGANSLLKTLEEPPEKTLIILVTQDYESLLKTIISRTQLIKVPNYTSKEATDEEMNIAEKYRNTIREILNEYNINIED
jgi:DNA polymerase-3 subunit delta'